MNRSLILKLSCPDRIGLVSRLTGLFAGLGGNLLEVHQFTDKLQGWFFTRIEVDADSLDRPFDSVRQAVADVVADWGATWSLRRNTDLPRMVILVSKYDHCLADLLYRWRWGELPVTIPAVLSNHDTLAPLVEREGIPFRRVPIPREHKEPGFRELADACRAADADMIVLARFMQILPDWFCDAFAGRLINIHHSFLPAFVGANPYRRAYERGVKLIGATCHYATTDLDEGPIIDQEVVRVDHSHEPDDLLRLGRDCERLALARGVRFHAADRVLVHGSRTVVFRD